MAKENEQNWGQSRRSVNEKTVDEIEKMQHEISQIGGTLALITKRLEKGRDLIAFSQNGENVEGKVVYSNGKISRIDAKTMEEELPDLVEEVKNYQNKKNI